MAGEVLTPQQVREIMSKSRTKGAGERYLQEFLERNNPGEVVDLENGILAGKSPESAQATLNNAINKTRKTDTGVELVNPQFKNLLVKKVGKGDEAIVALINTAAEGGAEAAAAAEGA